MAVVENHVVPLNRVTSTASSTLIVAGIGLLVALVRRSTID